MKSTRKIRDETIVWSYTAFGKDVFHRENGPAVIHPDGTMEWWVRGKLDRGGDKPAIKHPNYRAWYREGRRHRSTGPAIVYSNGGEEYYIEGKRHRCDGPAFRRPPENAKDHWLEEYWIDGKLHRVDGPAREIKGCLEEWYLNDLLHRLDGPARTSVDGWEWHYYGDCHRLDGPAVHSLHHPDEFFVFGLQLTDTEFFRISRERTPAEIAVAFCLEHPSYVRKVSRYLRDVQEFQLLHTMTAALNIL